MPRFGGLGTAFGRMGAGGKVPAPAGVSAPVNQVAPVISGNTQVTQTLSTTDGTWTGSPSFTYQWQRAGVDIASATANTYVLVEADAGAAITCNVTGTNVAGNATAGSNTLTTDVYAVLTAHVEDPTDLTTYSGGVWNGVAIGVAAANRIIVLAATARGTAGALTSGTVAGNATTSRASQTADTGSSKVDFRTVSLATGTTANLVFVWSGGPQNRMGCGVWALYGAGSEVASDTKNSITDPSGTLALAVPAKGVGLGASIAVQGTSTTWTGLTERVDTAIETTVCHSFADINSNAGGTVNTTVDWTAAQTNPGVTVVAAWGP